MIVSAEPPIGNSYGTPIAPPISSYGTPNYQTANSRGNYQVSNNAVNYHGSNNGGNYHGSNNGGDHHHDNNGEVSLTTKYR